VSRASPNSARPLVSRPWPSRPITPEEAEQLLLPLLLESRDAEGLAGVLRALIAWCRQEAARPPIALPGPG
jgi:hypothetical protein